MNGILSKPRVFVNYHPLYLLWIGFLISSISGCDSERDKEWKKWQTEIRKVDYVCGMFGDYELRLNRKYIFFWPTYEGRSDWEPGPPPPTNCDAKLQSVAVELFWPEMNPAGDRTFGDDKDPDRINASIAAVPDLKTWDLRSLLKYYLSLDETASVDFSKFSKSATGLYTDNIAHRDSKLKSKTYFWAVDKAGTVNTVIECEHSDNGLVNRCEHTQYLRKFQAVMDISYQRAHLSKWKVIAFDVERFIERIAIYKGE